MIETPLNKAQALELFANECVYLGGADAVEEHRIAELFGYEAANTLVNSSYLEPGRDYNYLGACTHDDLFLCYCYLSGFMKLVSGHNHRLQVKAHKASEGGAIIDALRKKRDEEFDAMDAEEERKRKERAEKRKAARKAREEAKKQAERDGEQA